MRKICHLEACRIYYQIVKNNLKTKLVAYTLPEKYLFNSGPRNWMQKKYGLDKNKIIQKINKYI